MVADNDNHTYIDGVYLREGNIVQVVTLVDGYGIGYDANATQRINKRYCSTYKSIYICHQ